MLHGHFYREAMSWQALVEFVVWACLVNVGQAVSVLIEVTSNPALNMERHSSACGLPLFQYSFAGDLVAQDVDCKVNHSSCWSMIIYNLVLRVLKVTHDN